MASTRLRALWLIICCRRGDSAKTESQTKEVKLNRFFSGRPFLGPNSESGRQTAIKKRQADCQGEVWNRYNSILPKPLQLMGIAYQRISLGSQLAPQIWERTVYTKELKNVSKDALWNTN